jgi:hypothetical protein
MAKYTVIIHSEDDLSRKWIDNRAPNFNWGFIESSLDECVKINEDSWEASYESMEIESDRIYTYIHPNSGEAITYTLLAGEYGIYS